LLAAAACHLGLVVAGGLDRCLWEHGLPGRLLTYYAALSGTSAGYSYFAPAVGAPLRATFTIVGDDGRTAVDALATGRTREADIRAEDLVEVFNKKSRRSRSRAGRRGADDRVRRDLARSWAAAMFARHPAAASVIVDVGYERVPSLSDAQSGAAPRWESIYRARIVRAGDLPAKGPS
jgi:hypothetical protein